MHHTILAFWGFEQRENRQLDAHTASTKGETNAEEQKIEIVRVQCLHNLFSLGQGMSRGSLLDIC